MLYRKITVHARAIDAFVNSVLATSPGSSIALGGGGGGGGVAAAPPPPLPDDNDLQITCCVILRSPDYSVVRTNVNEAVEHDRAGVVMFLVF